MIQGCNKKIACEPPDNKGAVTEVNKGFASVQHRSSLMALKVVFGSAEYPTGSTVYLPAGARPPWAQQVHELNGTKFVLVPEEQIILMDRSKPLKPDLPKTTKPEYFQPEWDSAVAGWVVRGTDKNYVFPRREIAFQFWQSKREE